MTERIENRADDSLDPVHGTLRDNLAGSGAEDESDGGTPVGEADVDADRARSGADPEGTGGSPAGSLLAPGGGTHQTGGEEPVGSADRDADAERSR